MSRISFRPPSASQAILPTFLPCNASPSDNEKYLAKLTVEIPSFTYNVLRQGLYTESYGLYLAFLDLKFFPAELKILHDGTGPEISRVKRDELGEGTAHLLADYAKYPTAFPHVNNMLLLSGLQ